MHDEIETQLGPAGHIHACYYAHATLLFYSNGLGRGRRWFYCVDSMQVQYYYFVFVWLITFFEMQ